MWVGIVERALGVLRSNIGWTADPSFPLRGSIFPQECTESISIDKSLNLLTGRHVRDLDLTSQANLHKHLTAAHNHRLPAVAELQKSSPYLHLPPREMVSGLMAKHAYAILNYDSKNKLVTVRDPNGFLEPENTDQTALDGQRDGVFTMPLSRFAKVFSGVTVLK